MPSDPARHEFVFTNTGKATLEITAVQPGCGCTTTGTWDRKVEPGQTGKIPIQFNPGTFNGTVTKNINVTCNDPVQGMHSLEIKATIWRPIDVQPNFVHFLQTDGEETTEAKVVRIINNLDEPLTVRPPQVTNPAFKTEMKTLREGKEYELRVTLSGPANSAGAQSMITIPTSSTNTPSLTVSAFAMFQPAVMAMPAMVQLPMGPITADKRFTVMVRSNARVPLQITEAQVDLDGAKVELQETEPGKVFNLSVAFPANFVASPEKTLNLTVKTSHPKYAMLKIPMLQPRLAAPIPMSAPATPTTVTR